MRCVSVMLSMILILYFPISAYAQCSGGVNPLYDESVMPDSDFFVSSMQKKANSGAVPQSKDPNPKPLVKQGNVSVQAATNATNESSGQVQAEPAMKLLDVNGKWSVRFNESSDRSLELILFPSTSSDKIMGSGTLAQKDARISLTASGSVTEDQLLLTAKTVVSEFGNKIDEQFDLNLVKINEAFSGTYEIKSGGKVIGKGNSTAIKS